MKMKLSLCGVLACLLLPTWAMGNQVVILSPDAKPIVGAKIYCREFTGRLDTLRYGPTGFTEEIYTSDAQGRAEVGRGVATRMPGAFGTDYALILADGYDWQLVPRDDLHGTIYLKPVELQQFVFNLPDGSPAAGATFIVTGVSRKTYLLNDPTCGVKTPFLIAVADNKGMATLPCVRKDITRDGVTDAYLYGVAYTDTYVNEKVALHEQGEGTSTIELHPAQQVKGVVTDARGNKLAGAIISCDEYPLPVASSDKNGEFTFAHLPTSVPQVTYGQQTFDGLLSLNIDFANCVRQGISLLPTRVKADKYVIKMEPLITVTGKLVDKAGQQVTNSRKYGYYILIRHDLGPNAPGRTSSTFAETNQDGSFTLQTAPQSCLDVRDSFRDPTSLFHPTTYHDGDAITIPGESR